MDSDWELSKENIQPRKEGRDIKKLMTGLTPSKDVQRVKEMQQYEVALRLNDGDDPLDIWCKYIIWTEQNFPMGTGIELKQLFERFIHHFHKNDRYANDERFVKIYLKYADTLMDPSDVFNYMHDQGIGSLQTSFYENWAVHLEICLNYKKADEVYQLGIARNAEPVARLQRLYKEFVQRFIAKVKHDVNEDEGNPKDKRETLATLKKTTQGRVSHDRVKARSAKVKGGLGVQTGISQLQGSAFSVYEEADIGASGSLQAARGEWKSAPVTSKMTKENQKKPGMWTSAKMSNTKGSSHVAGPMFAIHEDVQVREPAQTPKQVVMSERKPLSSRKITKEEARFNPIDKILQKDGDDSIARYCKNDVYQGCQEFSLEELRALQPKYALDNCTVYYPADMEETCVVSTMPDIVQEAPKFQERPTIDSVQVCDPNLESAKLKEADDSKLKTNATRQRLNFSTLDCKEECGNETSTRDIGLSSKSDFVQVTKSAYQNEICTRRDEIPTRFDASGFQGPNYDGPATTGLTASLGTGNKPSSYLNQERNALREWDVTEIESTGNYSERFCGPTESTSVHDIPKVPLNPFIEKTDRLVEEMKPFMESDVSVRNETLVEQNESLFKSFKPEVPNEICLGGDDLDFGNFSMMLAKGMEEERANVGFPFGQVNADKLEVNSRTHDNELPGARTSTAKSSIKIRHRPDYDSKEDEPGQSYVPLASGKVKPPALKPASAFTAFADVEKKESSSREKMSFSIFQDDAPASQGTGAQNDVRFSIFEDATDIRHNDDRHKFPIFEDSKNTCLPKQQFSIFQDDDDGKVGVVEDVVKENVKLQLSGKPMTTHDNKVTERTFMDDELSNTVASSLSAVLPSIKQRSDCAEPEVAPFAIFSDSCADIQMPSPGQKKVMYSELAYSRMGQESKSTVKNPVLLDGPFVKPQHQAPPSSMKRLQCNSLTPVNEQKQARFDDTGGKVGQIWAPSPTVHTRKATQEIFAMFNKTLECEANEFTLNQTQEVTNRFEPQTVDECRVTDGAHQVAKTKFDIYEETKVNADTGRTRQPKREEESCGASLKPSFNRSDYQGRCSESRSFSVTRDHTNNTFTDHHEDHATARGASTFCYPAAAPPRLSCTAAVGDFDCTGQGETTQGLEYPKQELSPIEEQSGESKGSLGSTADKSWMNLNGMSCTPHLRVFSDDGSDLENDRACLPDLKKGTPDEPPVFDVGGCDTDNPCTTCPQHRFIADALETSLARFPSQRLLHEVEEALGTIAINTKTADATYSSFEPRPVDPAKETASMMRALDFEVYPNLQLDSGNPIEAKFAAQNHVTLGDNTFAIRKKITAGGFSVVYKASRMDKNSDSQVALKVMDSPQLCQWEFYIGEEIHRRLDENEFDDSTHENFVQPLSGYIYSNGGVIEYPFYTGGTLLDLVNLYISQKGSLNETFALLYGLNVCRIVKSLHDCSIIHGDVKPDNFLLKTINSDLEGEDVLNCLTLTDFGKCINLSWFSKSTTFMGRSNTDKFECIEMTKDLPWKYQADYYGIACTLHVAYHGTYMDCLVKNGKHKPVKVFRRRDKEFWSSIFDRLINVPDCNDRAVLDGVIRDFQIKIAEPTRRKALEELLIFHSHAIST